MCFLFGFGILFIHGIHRILWSRTHKMVFCLKIVRVIYVCYCLQWMSYASVSSRCCCTQQWGSLLIRLWHLIFFCFILNFKCARRLTWRDIWIDEFSNNGRSVGTLILKDFFGWIFFGYFWSFQRWIFAVKPISGHTPFALEVLQNSKIMCVGGLWLLLKASFCPFYPKAST